MSIQKIDRELGREVKRLHENVGISADLSLLVSLLECKESGSFVNSYISLPIDMQLNVARLLIIGIR
jgi:hypothetical protein